MRTHQIGSTFKSCGSLLAIGLFVAAVSQPLWAIVGPPLPSSPPESCAPSVVFAGDSKAAAEPDALAPLDCTTPPNAPSNLTVMNQLEAYCALYLTWTAGSSNCSGTITYNIYRDVTIPFTPDPTPGTGNIIASGLTATVYEDLTALSSSTTYYYLVRAFDSVGLMEDTGATFVAGSPGAAVGTVGEGFEPGGSFQNAGWTIQVLSMPGSRPDPDPWMASGTTSYGYFGYNGTGVRLDLDWPDANYPAFPNSNQDPGGVRALVSPLWTISSSSVLTFWHTWSFENNYNGPPPSYSCVNCYDGAVLEYKHPADGSWTRITGAQILGATYNGVIDGSHVTDNPLGFNIPAWVGGTGTLASYAQAIVSIGALAGAGDVQVRWLQSDDTGNAGGGWKGWYLDEVEVTDVTLGGTCATLNGCTAPGAPDLTGATGTLCGVIDLAWTAGSGTTSSYDVYRSVFSGGPYQKINGTPVMGTSYSDTTAVTNTTYYYVVRGACDAFGVYESANSNQRSAASGAFTAPAAPGAPSFSNTGATSVTVSWGAVSGAMAYDLYRVDGGCVGAGAAIATNVVSVSYNDRGLASSQTYGYYVIARNNCGSSSGGTCASVTALEPPPWTPYGGTSGTAMQALKNDAGAADIQVTWDATCASTGYEIVYGMGSLLPMSYGGTYGVTGVVCSIGNTGAADWSVPAVPDPSGDPSRFLWFLVVATDGQLTEGPWGLNSGGVERMGPGTHGSSGNLAGCTRTDKVTSNSCGQ